MDPPPLVSVVLATNRPGPFLSIALDALVAQTWTEWELVLVDDGAPEPGALDLAAAGLPRARVVHQANAGVSVARNVGIAHSTGTYLAFLDDDDLWEPERLQRGVGAFEGRPDAVASYSQWDVIDGRGRTVAPGDLCAGDLRAFLRLDARAPLPTLMVTRAALDRAGTFHPMLTLGEDLDLTYRLARIGAFVFVPDVLVHYRRHDGNVTNDHRTSALASVRALRIQQWWSADRGELALLDDIALGMRRTRGYWTRVLVRASAHDLRRGRLREAGRSAAFVARHDPWRGLRSLVELARRSGG